MRDAPWTTRSCFTFRGWTWRGAPRRWARRTSPWRLQPQKKRRIAIMNIFDGISFLDMISLLRRTMKIVFTLPVLSGTDGLVGYDARLTRERSPVRTRVGVLLCFAFLIFFHHKRKVLTTLSLAYAAPPAARSAALFLSSATRRTPPSMKVLCCASLAMSASSAFVAEITPHPRHVSPS